MKIPIGFNHDAVEHDDRRERSLPFAAAVWPALIAIALVVVACGGEKADGVALYFPQRSSDHDSDSALLIGELVAEGKCLYVASNVPPEDDSTYLIFWPHNAEVRFSNNGVIEIHDGSSQAVLRVGDEVRLGGGESNSDDFPDTCHGPYWVSNPGITRVDR